MKKKAGVWSTLLGSCLVNVDESEWEHPKEFWLEGGESSDSSESPSHAGYTCLADHRALSSDSTLSMVTPASVSRTFPLSSIHVIYPLTLTYSFLGYVIT